ncbi:hypothetical protein [Metabacillus sp. 84]|uniref:hypothetical protein n=1 Tax=unclassified Metabacillus TaxID=2675274 RepID=UPI003CF4DFDA
MNWKEYFTNDIEMNFRTDTVDLEAAIESYVNSLSEEEVLQLTKRIDAEELREVLAEAMLKKLENFE